MSAVSEPAVVVGIDQGTTNTKALALNLAGQVLARHSVRTHIVFPRAGWVESDAMAIYDATMATVDRCLADLQRPPVIAIGISNQRESAVMWDRATGEPLGPVVSWQCQRSEPLCDRLRRSGLAARIRELSGLELSPMFSAGKFAWLLDQLPDGAARARDGEICLGTVDSWLLWKLSGGRVHATDLTNASRTQLLDLESGQWSDELLDIFAIPRGALADVRPSAADYGACTLPGGAEASVCALAGDSHASLVAHGVLAPGGVKATFGTGTSVLAPVRAGQRSAGLSETIGWSRTTASGGSDVVRALEGNIYATGAVLELAANLVGLVGLDGLDGLVGRLEPLARADCGAARGVYFVPAFSGLGAPHWDATATGIIIGLTRGSDSHDIARAAFEAAAFQVRDVIEALPEPPSDGTLHVDGGTIQSDVLAALVADITGLTVVRPSTPDLSAVGAGVLAGHQVGLWPDLDGLDRLRSVPTRFDPAPDSDWGPLHDRWVDAVWRSRGWNTSPSVPNDPGPVAGVAAAAGSHGR